MASSLWDEVPALLDGAFPLPIDRPFTSRQAEDVGISRRALARLVRDGLLRRMLKGVYVAAQVQDCLLLRAEALRLVVPPDAVITDRTAAWLLGAAVLAPGDHLRVPPISIFRARGHTRLRNDLCASGQRTFVPGDLVAVHGLLVTSPLRTSWDLGRLLPRDQALGALDAMLRLGRFEHEELLAGVERFARQRGVVQLRDLAPQADPRSQSMGESALRLRWLDVSSLPRPTPQAPILDDTGREVYYLDLGVPELRYAAEYDGQRYHSAEADKEHDRRRRSWIATNRDWDIDVFGRDNVYGARRDVEQRLWAGITAARRRLGRFTPL